jgi:hypothetical protein
MNNKDDLSLSTITGAREPKWKNVLIICSLLFNLILAGFILYHLATAPIPPPIPPRFDHNREHIQGKRIEIMQKRKEFIEHKHRFMEKLAARDFEEAELRAQLEQLLDKQIQLERAIAENFIEMRKNMDDIQAERFFRELPERIRERNEMLRNRRR